MAIYKTRWFDRWALKQGLTDGDLCRAVAEMSHGLFDARLGASLFKKRVSRPGQGKRGGYRTLVATNLGDRWMFVFGFAKNERDNVSTRELLALKSLAEHLVALTEPALTQAQQAGELTGVNCHAQEDRTDSASGT